VGLLKNEMSKAFENLIPPPKVPPKDEKAKKKLEEKNAAFKKLVSDQLNAPNLDPLCESGDERFNRIINTMMSKDYK
jgi:hypothetical protein